MVIELTAQTIMTWAGVASALGVLVGILVKLVRWVDEQEEQGKRITDLEAKHDSDMQDTREESQMLMYGILSCLKGLQEQGCNGPVTEAIGKFEKYLNEKAHDK